MQLLDARDLASWVVAMTERREEGVYNAVGPKGVLTMREILETCREAVAEGLAFRPLAETVRDTLAWASEAPEERASSRLTPEKEAELLRKV